MDGESMMSSMGFLILSLSTGDPHPLAAFPNGMRFESGHSDFTGAIDLKISGDFFSLSYSPGDDFRQYGFYEGEPTIGDGFIEIMFVYNWKTGERIFRSAKQEAFVFLDLPYVLRFTREQTGVSCLEIQNIETSAVIVRLSLPHLPADKPVYLINGAQELSRSPRKDHHYPFQSSPDHSMIFLFTGLHSSRAVTIIPCSALRDLVNRFASPNIDGVPSLPWGTWPQVTSLLPSTCQQYFTATAYGRRLAINSFGSGVKIFEFEDKWMTKGFSTVQGDDSFTMVPLPQPRH
ncbi:hypothetical protein BDN72DRAFT_903100 [Pluteus cervinus]|uniref:Uncharacterized protein n=1 Tax=Pluteus cervinus TaxID=181527 RepID=A0ACD3AAH2_9AGAR|nr:hypothetical protein BDN72DRAFT_903100 [Pluteus cervinus]